jgi:hypothetical protein
MGHNADCRYAQCHLFIIMLSAIILSVLALYSQSKSLKGTTGPVGQCVCDALEMSEFMTGPFRISVLNQIFILRCFQCELSFEILWSVLQDVNLTDIS